MEYNETLLGSPIEVRCVIQPKASASPDDLKELGKILSLLPYIQFPAAELCVSDLDESVSQLLSGEFPLPSALNYATTIMDKVKEYGPDNLDQLLRESGNQELADKIQFSTSRDFHQHLTAFLKDCLGEDYAERIVEFTVSGQSSGVDVCATEEDEERILDALHIAIPENLVDDVHVRWINPAGGPGTRERVINWDGTVLDE